MRKTLKIVFWRTVAFSCPLSTPPPPPPSPSKILGSALTVNQLDIPIESRHTHTCRLVMIYILINFFSADRSHWRSKGLSHHQHLWFLAPSHPRMDSHLIKLISGEIGTTHKPDLKSVPHAVLYLTISSSEDDTPDKVHSLPALNT